MQSRSPEANSTKTYLNVLEILKYVGIFGTVLVMIAAPQLSLIGFIGWMTLSGLAGLGVALSQRKSHQALLASITSLLVGGGAVAIGVGGVILAKAVFFGAEVLLAPMIMATGPAGFIVAVTLGVIAGVGLACTLGGYLADWLTWGARKLVVSMEDSNVASATAINGSTSSIQSGLHYDYSLARNPNAANEVLYTPHRPETSINLCTTPTVANDESNNETSALGTESPRNSM